MDKMVTGEKRAQAFVERSHFLFIDGNEVEPNSRKSFDVFNPATGKVITQVAAADEHDVDIAVRSARKAFDNGTWSDLKPAVRSRILHRIADMIEQTMDLDQVQEIARGAVPLVDNPLAQASAGASLKPRIGVIRDAAFNFYYPENLQALEELGAELVFFSALDKALPPELDAVYIGGGFPETSAQQLADNESFRRDLRAKIEQGLPVYAECGGLTYLSESIAVGDETFPMVGVFPVSFEVAKKPQGHGYTIAEIDRPNVHSSPTRK